jgi:hypothetical protein
MRECKFIYKRTNLIAQKHDAGDDLSSQFGFGQAHDDIRCLTDVHDDDSFVICE